MNEPERIINGKYLLSAVTQAVSDHFVGHLAVLNEAPPQDTQEEFLLIQQIRWEQIPDTARYHNRLYLFDIYYHPDEEQKTPLSRSVEIVEELCDCLTYVYIGEQPSKASTMRAEMKDGVFHFFVSYPIQVMLAVPRDPDMQRLNINQTIKE